MLEPAILATVAGIIAGIGTAVLPFRVHRELLMAEKREPVWLPWADHLLVAATLVSLLLVLLPVVLGLSLKPLGLRLASAGCAFALVLTAGYVPAVLAHYRIMFGKARTGPRQNPEPAERFIVVLCVVLASLSFGFALVAL